MRLRPPDFVPRGLESVMELIDGIVPNGNTYWDLGSSYGVSIQNTPPAVIGVGGRALAWPGPTQARLRPGPGPAQVKRKGSPKLKLDVCFIWIPRKHLIWRCANGCYLRRQKMTNGLTFHTEMGTFGPPRRPFLRRRVEKSPLPKPYMR